MSIMWDFWKNNVLSYNNKQKEEQTNQYTVEPLKEDPPRKGHCIKYLSTMDKTKSPNLSLPINIMRLEPLKRGQPL